MPLVSSVVWSEGCWIDDVTFVIRHVELWYNTIMTITNIPLNGTIDNDGSIRCFYEIQTQEALQQFYDDEIEPQLIHELDAYLNSDY